MSAQVIYLVVPVSHEVIGNYKLNRVFSPRVFTNYVEANEFAAREAVKYPEYTMHIMKSFKMVTPIISYSFKQVTEQNEVIPE